ncbi:hypothetical protein Tco_0787860 [Tanacetum coccineum]
MRDFHKTHPSGFGTITKTTPSAAKIKPSITNEGTSVIPGVPDVTEEESSENSDQKNDSDDDKTQSDNENESNSKHETDENESGSESDQEENKEDIGDDEDETKITDKAEGDEDKEMDYNISQLYDDVDIRLIEPVDTDKRVYSRRGPQSTPTPPPTTEATNPQSTLSNFASVFQFNNRVTALEKEVVELKKDPLHT